MTLDAKVFKDGELVIQVHDKRDAGWTWQRNTRFNNIRNVKNLFNRWVKGLQEMI